MTLENAFCSSPWLHMRINTNGDFGYCRWSSEKSSAYNIRNTDIQTYFQSLTPVQIRQTLLAGESPAPCAPCYKMEQHGKISGRQRQLLKIGIMPNHWLSTMSSSEWLPVFRSSDGTTDLLPVDWQIDLGNHCNSACVFCHPKSSSRLAEDWRRIGLIDKVPSASWCQDPVLLQKFIDVLCETPNLKYLHFIGGETLLTPAFTEILRALCDADMAKNVTVGFTTNLTVWDESITQLLQQFDQVNLGLSVECFDRLNDYVRWPSRIESVQALAERWIELAKQQDWLVQLRVTPTVLTVHKLLSVYDFAMTHQVVIEACNFLADPGFMRMSLLPMDVRRVIVADMRDWIARHDHDSKLDLEINSRNASRFRTSLCQDLDSYCRYLENESDNSDQLGQLVDYLKRLETIRNNSVLDYLPEYESIFRSHGY